MRNTYLLRTCLLTFALLTAHLPVCAEGKFAIDVLHGARDIPFYWEEPSMDSLYTDCDFIRLDGERIPIYYITEEGEFTGDGEELFYIHGAGPNTLYVMVEGDVSVFIFGSDGSVEQGQQGVCHMDNPYASFYVVCVTNAQSGTAYRIGYGPHIADVYPYDDYDAVLRFWRLYTMQGPHGGYCETYPHWSDEDINRMQALVDSGGSAAIFYDEQHDAVDKPIVHLKDFAVNGATLEFDFPGRLTVARPEPRSRDPLLWEVAPTTADVELVYEGFLDQHLNFVSRGNHRDEYVNRSWATLRDVKIIRFERDVGYQIAELGTLAPGERAAVMKDNKLPLELARDHLDRQLHREARAAGLDHEEAESFFSTYQWGLRSLAEACDVEGVVILYRIEGEDYDSLIPLDADPIPTEIRRVLWVISALPDDMDGVAPVHPRATPLPLNNEERVEGSLHEYGFSRELYRSRALDEIEGFGWSFTGCQLGEGEAYHRAFRTSSWGTSPLVAELTAGVTELRVDEVCAIDPQAGVTDVVVSGGDSVYASGCEDQFPMGSYPPIVVAREEASGARLVGYGDHSLLWQDEADNLQFTRNVLDWLAAGPTGTGPDIDIPVAVIETTLTGGGSGVSGLDVFNSGTEPLELTMSLPPAEWISVSGPTDVTIPPGDSAHYELTWSADALEPGYHITEWVFFSNDPNEAQLSWMVRLRVLEVSGAHPQSDPAAATQFRLLPVYPNPFNPSTTLAFTLPRAMRAQLRIFDVTGRLITTIADGRFTPGSHTFQFDGGELPAGIYFAQLRAQHQARTQKLVLLK